MGEVVRFRPFWSLFIVSTENWMRQNSEAGLHIESIDFARRRFLFKKGEPVGYRYCFGYNKFGSAREPGREKAIKKSGWRKLLKYKKWSLYRSENANELGVMPNRRGLYLHNNARLSAYNILSFLLLITAVCVSIGFVLNTRGHTLVPAYILTVIFTVLILLNFFIFLFFSRSNNSLLEELGSSLNPEYAIYRHSMRNKTFEKWLEKLFIREGDIKRKFWPFWYLSPDLLEKRLESLERSGSNLYKTNKSGTVFYFTSGAPRTVCYRVAGSLPGGMDDTVNYLLNGWNVVFSTTGQLIKLTLLAKPYEGRPPELFSTRRGFMQNVRSLAGRNALITVILLLFVLAVTAVLLVFRTSFCLIAAALGVAGIAVFVRLLLYYRRSVKAAENLN